MDDKQKELMASQIHTACADMQEVMGWTEQETYKWMAASHEELDDNSPAALIIEGNYEKLQRFIAGARKVAESFKKDK